MSIPAAITDTSAHDKVIYRNVKRGVKNATSTPVAAQLHNNPDRHHRSGDRKLWREAVPPSSINP
jgi:hypothetical protein